jgi:O-acetyl-ADP-ribose deacetylase (regulator of RNase III)
MIEYVEGNLLKSDCDVVVQGCNCFCTQNSGIARQIRDACPEAYEADYMTVRGDRNKLGTLTYADVNFRYWVNLYTQYRYGVGVDHFSYDTFPKGLKSLADAVTEWENDNSKTLKVGMPLIGAGLAGGDWSLIEAMIEDAFPDRTIYIYKYRP